MSFSMRTLAGSCAMIATMQSAVPAQALVVGAYHILPLPQYYERTGKQPPGGGDGPLYYYGGSVFSYVKVVTVIWGRDVNQETIDKIPMFTAAIVNSTYMDQMAENGTTNHKGVNGNI